MAAVLVTLIIQSTPVSFGAVDTPILVGVNTGLGGQEIVETTIAPMTYRLSDGNRRKGRHHPWHRRIPDPLDPGRYADAVLQCQPVLHRRLPHLKVRARCRSCLHHPLLHRRSRPGARIPAAPGRHHRPADRRSGRTRGPVHAQGCVRLSATCPVGRGLGWQAGRS
jgi:hypothetical protein